MSNKPRVFISHSAKEPEARTLCGALNSCLSDADFEVLWDKNLQTSEAWRAAIDEWIWRCDAAVLVLSRAATDSRYVAYEAALLLQRWKHMSGQFVLVPIWCSGVTGQVLNEKMGALQLSEIQTTLKLPDWPQNAANDPAVFGEICQSAVKALGTLKTRLHARHNVEELLINELYFGAPTEEALRAIADKYKVADMPSGAKKDIATVLAQHMLEFDSSLGVQRFEVLAAGIDVMMTVLSESSIRVPRIVNLVSPFCWVSPNGAGWIASLSFLPAGQHRVVAWRRSWMLSEKMYLYRAFCTRSTLKLKIASASDRAGGGEDRILDHIRSVLAAEVCQDQLADETALAVKVKELTRKGVPVFLLLPAHAVDKDIVSKVCRKWPEVCIFLFGEELDEAQVRNEFPGVDLVDPPLASQEETAAKTGWSECLGAAGVPFDDRVSGAAFK